MENCISDLMVDPKMQSKYPNHKERKSHSIAICHSSIMGNKKIDMSDINKSVWSTAIINNFPDSSFAYVEHGKKDKENKTIPRSKRHLPYKDANGKIDPAHVRNALARLNQTDIPASAKASARTKLVAAAKQVGIEIGGKVEGGENMTKKTVKKQDEEPKEEVAEETAEIKVTEEAAPEVKEEEVAEETKEETTEEAVATEGEAPAEEAKDEATEEVAASDKVTDLVKQVLDKIQKLEESLKKQDDPQEGESASAEGAASEEAAPEEPAENAVVEDTVSAESDSAPVTPDEGGTEGASLEGAEVSKVYAIVQKVPGQIEKLEKALNEKLEALETRIKTIEEQPAPSKVVSAQVVTKGGNVISPNQQRLEEINKELTDLEEMKKSDMDKFQKEKKWEKAFSLMAERDQLKEAGA